MLTTNLKYHQGDKNNQRFVHLKTGMVQRCPDFVATPRNAAKRVESSSFAHH